MKAFKGHFITLEGGEGAGKSSLLVKLIEYLSGKNYEVLNTREPGGTALGEKIREMLLNHDMNLPICASAELLMFLAARAQHIDEVIKPALQQGQIILCDRYNDSTIAYQTARGLDKKFIQQLCQMVCGPIVPELTLFLDLDPQIGLERTRRLDKENATTGRLDRIEQEKNEFHATVRNNFLQLAKREPLRIYRIDASCSPQEVYKEAVRAIEEFILLPLRQK